MMENQGAELFEQGCEAYCTSVRMVQALMFGHSEADTKLP